VRTRISLALLTRVDAADVADVATLDAVARSRAAAHTANVLYTFGTVILAELRQQREIPVGAAGE
jgi:hypothetical protein